MSTDDRHERFDQPTVELVAKALPFALPSASRGVARHVLNALAEAGLLLPPGGEVTEQRDGHTVAGRLCLSCGVDNGSHRRTITTWPDGSRYESAWTEVPQ